MKEIFSINLKRRLEKKLEKEVTASNFSEIMKEEENKLAGKTKEKPLTLSTEDQKIKQLGKVEGENWERRKTGQRESWTKQWKRSADKDHKRNEQIMLTLCL